MKRFAFALSLVAWAALWFVPKTEAAHVGLRYYNCSGLVYSDQNGVNPGTLTVTGTLSVYYTDGTIDTANFNTTTADFGGGQKWGPVKLAFQIWTTKVFDHCDGIVLTASNDNWKLKNAGVSENDNLPPNGCPPTTESFSNTTVTHK